MVSTVDEITIVPGNMTPAFPVGVKPVGSPE